jgi:hypothetical protein
MGIGIQKKAPTEQPVGVSRRDTASVLPCDSGVTVARATTPPEVESIVSLFEGIAAAEGWTPEGELRAHVARSIYFGLWHHGCGGTTPVGGLQLVRTDGAGRLPSQRVWPELPIETGAADIAHIAMLAVEEEWRGRAGGLFWMLTAAMWNRCVRCGISELWLEATPRTLRCYRRFGWPIAVRGELREHWGEQCFPCSLSVREVAGALAEKAVRSEAYRRILAAMISGEGAGTDVGRMDSSGTS